VVRSSKIQVTTFDGQVYSGKLLATLRPQGIDVALVQFQSSKVYAIATIGNPKTILEGDFTFAAGYPLDTRNGDKITGLKMTSGNVALKLDQPLRQGHQIGYTNEIERGMSGGPLLDINANLIGINAKHAYPFRQDSYTFQDNMLSAPCKPLKNLMFRSAWAIPIDVAINQAEKLTGLVFEHPHSNAEVPLVIGIGIPPVTIDFNKINFQQKNWQQKNQIIETANLAKKCKE
jgi:S1-C subfamily serine protease